MKRSEAIYPAGTKIRGQVFGWDEALYGEHSDVDWSASGGPRFVEGALRTNWVDSLSYWQYTVGREFLSEVSIVPVSGIGPSRWDDESIMWPKESKWVKDRRRLQSWYRETILRAPPGYDPIRKKLLGSLLAQPHADQGLNFLYRDIAEYAHRRAWEVAQLDGTLEADRLKRNMLSSMPMCFNLFGQLRTNPEVAADVLSKLLGIEITSVDRVEVEYAPPKSSYLNDRTAFDAYVEYRNGSKRGFLGIETKYTDSFSPTVYGKDPTKAPKYVKYTRPSFGWKPDSYEAVKASATNQVWRNVMLGLALRDVGDDGGKFDEGYVVVVSCADDRGAAKAVGKVNALRKDDFLRQLSLEEIVDDCVQFETMEDWANEFKRRYLDLSPVQA